MKTLEQAQHQSSSGVTGGTTLSEPSYPIISGNKSSNSKTSQTRNKHAPVFLSDNQFYGGSELGLKLIKSSFTDTDFAKPVS